jgi:hypothetical protein
LDVPGSHPVEAAVEAVLRECEVTGRITVEVSERTAATYRQERRGRPGVMTRYVRRETTRFAITHRVEFERLDEEARCDGVFPLVTNDRTMTERELLLAYKQQPAIERRFEQLKTDFAVAPVYLKEASRIQALLCVYFFVLLVEALLERELRQAMERSGIEDLPLYPEGRAALNALAAIAPGWIRAQASPEWFDRYAARVEETRLPKGQEARSAHAELIGADGYRLMDALTHDVALAWLWQIPAVEVLRRVWLTQFYLDDGRVRWRTVADLAPAGQRINSPYDPEATFGNKRTVKWIGYNVHITETCEDDQVHLLTNVETTSAVTADVDQTAPIHVALAAKGLLPGDHRLDAGYVDVELLVGSQFEHGVRLVGPVRPDVSWQAQAKQGFDVAHFVIDWEARHVTCPEGKTSVLRGFPRRESPSQSKGR